MDLDTLPPLVRKSYELGLAVNPAHATQVLENALKVVNAVSCPTCGAAAGTWCDKKRNVRSGGPSHLTRVDSWMKT